MDGAARVVVSDANVLINLAHVDLLSLLEMLPGFEFCICNEVDAEIVHLDHRRQVTELLERGVVGSISLEIGELATFAELRTTMGLGEASCIAIAESRGYYVASDEKRAFRREAVARLTYRTSSPTSTTTSRARPTKPSTASSRGS